MWKKISVALCAIALTLISAFMGAGTYACNTGQSFIIDFSHDTNKLVISNLSPGETVYPIIKIPNHDEQATKASILLKNVVCSENGVVEPEQVWYNQHGLRNDIDSVITFGLWIDRDGNTGGCNTAAGDKWIIEEKTGIHIDDITGNPIPLGTIDSGKTITVVTSYHMDEETENWAQSDTMTFNIELTREEVPINSCVRVSLESRQDTGASSNLGKITLQGQAWSLPSTVSTVAGGYSASYRPAPGYVFDHWETTGSVTATSTTANPTAVNVGGTGTLRAVYKVIEVLTVASPNGGESWIRDTTHMLTWASTGSPGANVKIELLKAGVVNRVITSSTANDGSFSWAIPSTQTLGTDYKIRITSITNAAITDSSNANFAVTAGALTVTSPNGGQSWVRGTAHTITWASTGSPGANVKIELLKAGVVNRVISASTANDGSYSWVIPTTQVAGSDYSIRITSTTNAAINDSSNTNFAITTSHDNVDIHRQPRGVC
jgi:5-hydroxyisourate hydrolase-like protein (transthyretin family)